MKTALVLFVVLSTAMLERTEANQVSSVKQPGALQHTISRIKYLHDYIFKPRVYIIDSFNRFALMQTNQQA